MQAASCVINRPKGPRTRQPYFFMELGLGQQGPGADKSQVQTRTGRHMRSDRIACRSCQPASRRRWAHAHCGERKHQRRLHHDRRQGGMRDAGRALVALEGTANNIDFHWVSKSPNATGHSLRTLPGTDVLGGVL